MVDRISVLIYWHYYYYFFFYVPYLSFEFFFVCCSHLWLLALVILMRVVCDNGRRIISMICHRFFRLLPCKSLE